ncbi:MAG: sugar ABC transporter permease, partial [Clostridia bacterium]|nr:sugar ABC transporter permease [Clostridia bacterium]
MQQVSQRRPNRAAAFLTSRKVVPYVVVAPFVIYFLLFYLYPTVSTVLMSFQRIDGPTTSEWIGLKNYQKLFSRNFIQALETSTRYAVWDVIILTIVPLLFAVLLHSGLVKGSAFFKSLFFIPALTSIIVAGIVFRLAFGTQDTAPV